MVGGVNSLTGGRYVVYCFCRILPPVSANTVNSFSTACQEVVLWIREVERYRVLSGWLSFRC